jgi:hypothetical protein
MRQRASSELVTPDAFAKNTLPTSALRSATAWGLDSALVASCLLDSAADRLFAAAWEHGFISLPRSHRRGALLGVMGHIAESAVELALCELDYAPVWHLVGPGRHGVDLIMLSPSTDHLVAVEVKSTFRPRQVPRLTVAELTQMSRGWLDRADNPGMREWALTADDVYGLVAVVNFSDRTLRYGATADFEQLHPIRHLDQVRDLRWLDD